MKIGILSMQRIINYGSYLQSYALYSVLSQMGYECKFVDIRSGKQLEIHKTTAIKHNKIWKHPVKKIIKIFFVKKREKSFRKAWEEIGIDKPVIETEVDCVVIGSDEVFNCLQHDCSWGFSLQLFGDTFVPAFSYAASFGHTEYDQLCQLGLDSSISHALKKLRNISVRDSSSEKCVQQLIGVTPYKHIDPVLMLDWKVTSIRHHYSNYILIYAYDNRININEEIEAIKQFAKKYQKKIISFGMYQRWADKNVLCEPFEMIQFFREADYIITDTFHGSVLSIKMNRPFVTIVRPTNKNKITDLLMHFSLQDRIVDRIDSLESIMIKDIDFNKINQTIKSDVEESKLYLKNTIEGIKR